MTDVRKQHTEDSAERSHRRHHDEDVQQAVPPRFGGRRGIRAIP
jgi:hypothetical protein